MEVLRNKFGRVRKPRVFSIAENVGPLFGGVALVSCGFAAIFGFILLAAAYAVEFCAIYLIGRYVAQYLGLDVW